MFILCGTKKVRHKIIWFLDDLEDFSDRKLYIFELLTKKKKATVLTETDKLTGHIYTQKNSGVQAINLMKREKTRIIYTSDDIKIAKGKPSGWTYGENIEVHNRNGEVIRTIQKRTDFQGQKEIIKSIDEIT